MSQAFSPEDVAAHNTKDDAWLIINGNVHDVTKFLKEHPGGHEVMMEKAGMDASAEFEKVRHSTYAKIVKDRLCIGNLK